jgi:hypothetical protein
VSPSTTGRHQRGCDYGRTRTREHIQDHVDAVLRGDTYAVVADFSQELRSRAPELASALPQPVTAASFLSVDVATKRAWR